MESNISKGGMYEFPNIVYELLMMQQIGKGIVIVWGYYLHNWNLFKFFTE